MADHAHAQAHDHDHDAHSPRHYIKIWVVLLVLLFISILGPEVSPHLGAAGIWVLLFTAFGIAFVKAGLVIKHFMHLTVEKPIVWYMLITCLVFLVLFFAGVSPDVHNHEGTNWTNLAAKEEIARTLAATKAHGGEHGEEGEEATTPEESPTPEVKPEEEQPKPEAKPAPATFADQKTDGAKKSWLMKRGAEVYVSSACITCHRSNGVGHGPFPTLVGQKDLMGDCTKTLGVITSGMSDPVTVGEKLFEQPMPPTKLSAEDAAAVATYVRNSWGNDFGVCAP